jgi:hypothetical protein
MPEPSSKTKKPSPIAAGLSLSGELATSDELSTPNETPLPTNLPESESGRLGLSRNLAQHIRELEKKGTSHPFRHRIALIGEARIEEKRPEENRCGALGLLEAVYAEGQAHWLDPVLVLRPLREILGKTNAPLGTEAWLYGILTRLARGRISPAAFLLHVVMPRMQDDWNWRQWQEKHGRVLDRIAQMLIELRESDSWKEQKLGTSPVLADVALCKYVGRPLCRLSMERYLRGQSHVDAWAQAWKAFTFRYPGFLDFLRQGILPPLYRLSGRIDPEQLSPIATAMLGLETTLGRRMEALGDVAMRRLLSSAGLSSSLEYRMERRLRGPGGAWAMGRDLRGYAELVQVLAGTDAGLGILSHVLNLSSSLDPVFLSDAASLARVVRRAEGVTLSACPFRGPGHPDRGEPRCLHCRHGCLRRGAPLLPVGPAPGSCRWG